MVATYAVVDVSQETSDGLLPKCAFSMVEFSNHKKSTAKIKVMISDKE